jgi:transposase
MDNKQRQRIFSLMIALILCIDRVWKLGTDAIFKRSMSFTTYPSDLTDAEWQYLEPLLPTPKATGRPRQRPLRLILNGIFYLVRSGCAWRMLPKEYPPWPTVHDYYRRWRQDGTWERIHTHDPTAGAPSYGPPSHTQWCRPR